MNAIRNMTAPSALRRRDVLNGALAAALVCARPAWGAEPPPETRRLRLPRFPYDVDCLAPQWVSEPLLRAEGFTQVEYVAQASSAQYYTSVAEGALDFGLFDLIGLLLALDAGSPVLALGGIHGGCYQLLARADVRSIRQLKGRTVAVSNAARRAFVSMMASHVGLDARRDLRFVEVASREGMSLFEQGKVDAFLGFPPEPQQLRARKVGVPIVTTAVDRPWSQHFCCVAVANREFVRAHPAATRRALRALVKATDLCAADPDAVARGLHERGFLSEAEFAAQALREIPYRRWRDYDSADSVRFYALRLREEGVVRSDPNRLIASGADWRFIDSLKRELKG